MTCGANLTVLVVSTSPREDSVSSAAADAVAGALVQTGVDVIRAAQRELPFVPAGLEVEEYPAVFRTFLRDAGSADAFVLAVPVHRSVVAGLARNLVEHLREQIDGKPVLPLVAAGSQRSTLAAQAFQADLLLNFNCRAMRAVLLSPDTDGEALQQRVATAVEDLRGALWDSSRPAVEEPV